MKDIQKVSKRLAENYLYNLIIMLFYKNDDMKKLLNLHKGIGFLGLLWDSKSNWPIENFWSMLKQEFINVHRIINVKEVEKLFLLIIIKEYIKN